MSTCIVLAHSNAFVASGHICACNPLAPHVATCMPYKPRRADLTKSVQGLGARHL